jgi:hypothetical protein
MIAALARRQEVSLPAQNADLQREGQIVGDQAGPGVAAGSIKPMTAELFD